MPKPKKILILGIWLILIPFFGVPVVWRTFLLYATGFILIADYFLRKKSAVPMAKENSEITGVNFTDNGQQ